jgi:hypothetical protein
MAYRNIFSDRRFQTGGASASYSDLNFGPDIVYPEFFLVFLSCSSEMTKKYVKLHNDGFIPGLFQFNIY